MITKLKIRDAGETPEEAVRREAMEEAGVDVGMAQANNRYRKIQLLC